MATITGGAVKLHRIETGLYSLDRAFEGHGKIGLPCHSLELFGPTSAGKTTLVMSLAGLVAKDKNIVMMDKEGNDQELMASILDSVGFTGELHVLEENKDEEMLMKLADMLSKKNFAVGILDSVGAISPVAEMQGDIGDRNVGHRGFIMAQFSRRMNSVLRGKEKNFFAINHVYPVIGFVGTSTPGGQALKYLAGNRVSIKVAQFKNKKTMFADGSYVIEGTVKKNRFGVQDRKFYAFVLGGQGVHAGLTAMWDCMVLKLVERETNIKKYLDAARAKDNTVFTPFIEALKTTDAGVEIAEDEPDGQEDT